MSETINGIIDLPREMPPTGNGNLQKDVKERIDGVPSIARV